MQKLPKYLHLAAIILWAVGALALLLTMSAQLFLPQNPQVFGDAGQGWVMPAWIVSIVAVLAAIILCKALYKKEKEGWLPFVLSLVGAVIGLVVALHLKGLLPEIVGLQYETQGLSTWKLMWRHLTPVAAGVLIAVASWINRAEARRIRVAAENASYKNVYDLPDEPIFHDNRSESAPVAKKHRKKKK